MIIGVEENPQHPNMFVFVIKQMEHKTGQIFKLTAYGSEEYRASVLADRNNYIGNMIRYKYGELTDKKLPRDAGTVVINGIYDVFPRTHQ